MFSVIIPLYNKQDSVARAIRSVLAQQDADFELIVVDDGSTDDSFACCQQFADPRLRLIKQHNQGVAAARNTGVAHATQQYVCFLDADDEYAHDFLRNMHGLTQTEPDAALYCCSYELIDEHGKRVPYVCPSSAHQSVRLVDFFAAFRQNRRLICASSFAMPRQTLLDLGGFPAGVTVGEDLYLWCLAALQGPVLHCASRSATVYQNAQNRTIHRAEQPLAWHSVVFLTDDVWTQGLSATQVQSVLSFVRYNTLVAGLGALQYGRRAVARGYAALLWRHTPHWSVLLWLASVLPRQLFVGLRHWRNRRSCKGPRS